MKIMEKSTGVNGTILTLKGRLDAHSTDEIEQYLDRLIDEGTVKIILNLDLIEYIGSSGIRIFLSLSRRLKEKEGALVIMKIPAAGFKVLKAMEIENLFNFCDTEEEACELIGANG